MNDLVLVTGADGYLGRLLVRRFLEGTDYGVLASVRAGDGAALADKAQRLHVGLAERERGGSGAARRGRVTVVPGELTHPAPFAAVNGAMRAGIRHIVHAAAVTRFDVDAATGDAVNRGGTVAVAHLARRCPGLASLTLCSTLYATGLRRGPITEDLSDDDPGYANEYERSKHAAERTATRQYADLPWRIARLATVVADDAGGRVGQLNAFHNTLRLCFHGLLPLLPGDASVPLYLITGRFAGDTVYRLATASAAPPVVHVSHDRAAAVSLGRLVDLAFAVFGTDGGFRRRHVLPPPFVDRTAFELFCAAVPARRAFVRAVLDAVRPFAAQLFVPKDVRTERLHALLGPTAVPDPAACAEAAITHLVRARWGDVRAAA